MKLKSENKFFKQKNICKFHIEFPICNIVFIYFFCIQALEDYFVFFGS